LHRGRYRPPPGIGLEAMVTLCLSGPAAETLFCGPINDGGDRVDIEMARGYLSQRFDPLTVGAEIARLRNAADRLVRTEWAQQRQRIVQIANGLLRSGSLDAEQIAALR
jgi:hypothetical protein